MYRNFSVEKDLDFFSCICLFYICVNWDLKKWLFKSYMVSFESLVKIII